ncbi:hypothetical protein CY34DRAFT_814503 [Suillus luteus UH-Slu-Lm8-n1]|uniref:Enoyl-CoA hydratase n=1 Tax=Suillus luteus UH-Slu-Lm8-n1 TaxID=930992 RepID=A0A0D0AII9_9AGAM|nr:hypothetical protein CY34DRAFT_814503 [Suillus luteus UH-Slu-Lm8-n1]
MTTLHAQREYSNDIVSRPSPGVALITLNRPKALDALNAAHVQDISDAMKEADEDAGVGAMILTGSERAFAAGADIKEMKDKSFAEAYTTNFLANWEVIAKLNKPVIAAVSGYAVCSQTHLPVTTSSSEFLPSARWWLGACIAS